MTATFLPLLNLLDREPWTTESLCSKGEDPEDWFPTRGAQSHDRAIRACRACPVIGQCAVEAHAANESWGIRAGVYLDTMPGKVRREVLAEIAAEHGFEVLDDENTVLAGHSVGMGAQMSKLKTHCRSGHEYTNENTGIHRRRSGLESRYCKACQRTSKLRREEQRDAEVEA